jgi:DNA-binding phage protein
MQPSMNQEQLKNIIKTALAEVLEERQDLLHEAVAAALEDISLSRAIKDGKKTALITRDKVFKSLEIYKSVTS